MIPTHELAVASIALFVGLIHGTWDWVVVPRTIRNIWLPNIVIVTILYTVISVPHVLLWYLEPSIGILIFLVFTVLHWGEEELYFTIGELGFTDFRGIYHKILLIVARGGMTVIYPLVFYSHDYRTVINAILDLFSSEGLQWLFVQDVRYTLAAIVTILLITHFTLMVLNSSDYTAVTKCFIADLKLAIWFLFMPVAVSIPVYLAIQHSSIHIGRVRVWYDDLKSMTTDSMPYLLGALALYGGGLAIFPASRQSLIGMAALYLVLLAILTVPHSFISLFIDIEEGLFAP